MTTDERLREIRERWFWWVCIVPYPAFVGVVFVWAIGFRVFGWW